MNLIVMPTIPSITPNLILDGSDRYHGAFQKKIRFKIQRQRGVSFPNRPQWLCMGFVVAEPEWLSDRTSQCSSAIAVIVIASFAGRILAKSA
jgi:hypothetical protein